jgi:hypothetical protein
MKNLRDLLLAAILLGAGGFGAYEIGSRVDHLSNQAASQDSEFNGTVTTTATTASPGSTGSTGSHHSFMIDGRHVTPLLMGAAVLVVLAAFFALALLKSVVKGRRRERWRVSN